MIPSILTRFTAFLTLETDSVTSQGHQDGVGLSRACLLADSGAFNHIKAREAFRADVGMPRVAEHAVRLTHLTGPVLKNICVVLFARFSQSFLIGRLNYMSNADISRALFQTLIGPSVKEFIVPAGRAFIEIISAGLAARIALGTDTIAR